MAEQEKHEKELKEARRQNERLKMLQQFELQQEQKLKEEMEQEMARIKARKKASHRWIIYDNLLILTLSNFISHYFDWAFTSFPKLYTPPLAFIMAAFMLWAVCFFKWVFLTCSCKYWTVAAPLPRKSFMVAEPSSSGKNFLSWMAQQK